MATSSIGKSVVLNDKTAKRFVEICAKPSQKAQGTSGPMKLCRDVKVFDRVK